MPPLLLTFAARVSDGLPLVAAYAQTTMNMDEQIWEAKQILRNLNARTSKMSVETSGSKVFHYLIQSNICYLTLAESSYPKRLAFLYLEDIADSFVEYLSQTHGQNYAQVIETTARPYAFIQADPMIQKKQREFSDAKSSVNSSKLNQDLSDIHSIMRQNISQVLDRGEKLENVSNISNNLMSESKKFKWGAKKLGFWAKVNYYAPAVGLGIFIIICLYCLHKPTL